VIGICRRGDEIADAAAHGAWTHDQRAHAASCVSCRDRALVAAALATPLPEGRHPIAADPARLWTRARYERRLRAEAQASRIVAVVQAVVSVAVVAALLVAASAFWPGAVWSWLTPGPDSTTVVAGAAAVMASGALLARWAWRARTHS
jgi:hypothetical protein